MKMLKNNRGFAVSELLPLAVAFVVVTITISLGAQVLGDIKADQTADSYEANATGEGQEALEELSSWLPTIALVVAAAVIIGIVVLYLAKRV